MLLHFRPPHDAYSGAQIASICNEAALYAARLGKSEVDLTDFEYGVDRVVSGSQCPVHVPLCDMHAGLERRRIITPEDKQKIAVHEAGHTLVSWMLQHVDPIIKVTVIPRGNSMGSAQKLPSDQKLYTTEQLLDRVYVPMQPLLRH